MPLSKRLLLADSVEKVAPLADLRQNLCIGRQGITQHDGTVIEWAGATVLLLHLEDHIPANHLLRSIDQCLDLSDLRHYLVDFYCPIGRPSIDPELMIHMLIVGYCFSIRSHRIAEDLRRMVKVFRTGAIQPFLKTNTPHQQSS